MEVPAAAAGADAAPAPSISVVVPTRDRPEALRRCLAALRAQTVPVELVVVDDGSERGEEVAAAVTAAAATLLRRAGEGPAGARNAGARAATGAAICFTDDDCEPAPDWAATLTAPLLAADPLMHFVTQRVTKDKDPPGGEGVRVAPGRAAAGRTVAAPGAGAADRAWHAIVGYLQEQAAAPGSASPGFAPTANLACNRELLEELPFDESFPAAAGEDRDWSTRAAAGGAAPTFVPEAVVVHRPNLSARTFLRQQYHYGRGAARYRASAPNRPLGSPSFYAGLLRAGFAAGPFPGALVLAAQLTTAVGALTEHLTARASRSR